MSAHMYDGPTARIFFSIPPQVDRQAVKEVWDGALCAQVDPELFFPDKGQSPSDARKVCGACPVSVRCLEVFGDLLDHGVVGGLTERERRQLRQSRTDGEAA